MAQGIDSIGSLGSDGDGTLKEGENAASKRERSGDDDGMLPGLILTPFKPFISWAHGNGVAGAGPWAAMMMMVAAVPSGRTVTSRRLGLGAVMMMETMVTAPRGGVESGSARDDALASVSGGRTSSLRGTMVMMVRRRTQRVMMLRRKPAWWRRLAAYATPRGHRHSGARPMGDVAGAGAGAGIVINIIIASRRTA